MSYKAMYKFELALAAGVSTSTFHRWLINDQTILQDMGVSPNAKLLPPCAVKFICDKYCIELSEQHKR